MWKTRPSEIIVFGLFYNRLYIFEIGLIGASKKVLVMAPYNIQCELIRNKGTCIIYVYINEPSEPLSELLQKFEQPILYEPTLLIGDKLIDLTIPESYYII